MVNVAVVGVGRMGSKHAKNLAKNIKGSNLVAVCDIDTQKANYFAKLLNTHAYYDADEMLQKEQLDAVVIATPHYSHVAIALKCLEKDINVLCEKPISVTTFEAKKLLEEYEKKENLICAMMYNQRTNRMYKKAKQLIQNNKIGKIQRVNFTITDWYRSQFYYNMGGWRATWTGEGGGTLINQCVHQIDLIQWLLGMPTSIISYCKSEGRRITTENDVSSIMRFEDQFNCMFSASTHEVPGENRLEIAGDKGVIIIGKRFMKYRINKLAENEINLRSKRDYGNKKDKTGKVFYSSYGLLSLIQDGIYGQQFRILKNFIECIETKNKDGIIADLSEGIKALTIINALNMSSWKEKEIAIPYSDEEYVTLLEEKVKEERGEVPPEETDEEENNG